MSTLPIRIREVVRPDGTRVRELLVFCPREATSSSPDRCARCGYRCPPENEALAPAVGCNVEPASEEGASSSDGLLYGPHAAASRVPAGAASAQVVVCIQADTPLSVASRVAESNRRWLAFPVVDETGVLLGSVPTAVLTLAADDERARFIATAESMVPSFAVRESDRLDEVIGTMTSHHLRHVPIIDDARRVTGLLTDIELLRWVARGAPARWR